MTAYLVGTAAGFVVWCLIGSPVHIVTAMVVAGGVRRCGRDDDPSEHDK